MCNKANIYLGLGSPHFVAVLVVSGAYQWSLVRCFGHFCATATPDSKCAIVSDGFCIYTFVDDSICSSFGIEETACG